MALVRSATKQMYKGKLQPINSEFDCDESDIDDLVVLGMIQRIEDSSKTFSEQYESTEPERPNRGRNRSRRETTE